MVLIISKENLVHLMLLLHVSRSGSHMCLQCLTKVLQSLRVGLLFELLYSSAQTEQM